MFNNKVDKNISECYLNMKSLQNSFRINNDSRPLTQRLNRSSSARSINISTSNSQIQSPSADYIEFLRRELKSTSKKNAELIAMFTDSQNQNKILQNEKDQLHSELNQLKSEYSMAIASQKEIFTNLRTAAKQTEAENNERIRSYENEIARNREQIANLMKKVEDYREMNENMKQSLSLLTEIATLKKQESLRDKEIMEYRQKNQNLKQILIETESSLSTTQIENSQLKAEIKSLESSNEKSTAKVKELYNIIDNKNKIITCLQSSYSGLRMSNGVFNKKVSRNFAFCENGSFNEKKICLTSSQKFLFSVISQDIILQFDIKSKEFTTKKLIDSKIPITKAPKLKTYNTMNGLYILSGDKSQKVYYYSSSSNTLMQIAKLKTPHENSCLAYDTELNRLFILSGDNTPSCEVVFEQKGKFVKNEFSPMLLDRSSFSVCFVNNEYLFAFFGFCKSQNKFLTSIERIEIALSNPKWEEMSYSSSITPSLINHISVPTSKGGTVLIFGGCDEHNQINADLLQYDIYKNEISSIKDKFPLPQQKKEQFVSFSTNSVEYNNGTSAFIDDDNNAYLLEHSELKFRVYNF